MRLPSHTRYEAQGNLRGSGLYTCARATQSHVRAEYTDRSVQNDALYMDLPTVTRVDLFGDRGVQ